MEIFARPGTWLRLTRHADSSQPVADNLKWSSTLKLGFASSSGEKHTAPETIECISEPNTSFVI
jgi:hypothetical protein